MKTKSPSLPALLTLAGVVLLAVSSCHRQGSAQPASDSPSASSEPRAAEAPAPPREAIPVRDLSVDESLGGHTLARHVGKTDSELAQRLRREREISSASTYTDRQSAERGVGAALASAGGKIAGWKSRRGRRPNLVLHYVDRSGQPLGRSLLRGRRVPVLADRVLVVLRWDERSGRFYVLTSYPEAIR